MEGKIIANLGLNYSVYADGAYYTVSPRGIFRLQNIKPSVGDNIVFDDETFSIIDIKARKNELIRPKSKNIDQIIIVMSIKEPDLSLDLLYKYLTYVLMNNIEAIVVFTKDDLIDGNLDISKVQDDLRLLNISSFIIGKNDCKNLEEIKKLLDNKVTLFMGQSGVGKSSLINLIDSSFDRKIGSFSLSRGRGKHQTKEVVLLPYKNGFIGDTPGFSALDLNIYKEDLASFFPGFNVANECYFSNCLHLNEKDCSIKKRLESGQLPKESYKIYLKILSELPYRKERYK